MFNSLILYATSLLSTTNAELSVLSCCKYANFNGREYERTGSMYISTRENGTEAPMYTSVGTNENGGNLITLNWENEDAGAGVKLAWPVLHVQTTAEIDGVPTALMEEHAKSNDKLHSNGEMKCPDDLKWTGADGKALDWTCDEAKEDACADQFEGCPTMAYENKCQTLKLICCVTCKKYFEEVEANKTAEAKLPAKAENDAENNSEGGDGASGSTSVGISNSISISTSMGTAPSSESGAPSRSATVTGGEWADITTTSIEAGATEDDKQETNSTNAGEELTDPEPESSPEGSSGLLASISIPFFILLVLFN